MILIQLIATSLLTGVPATADQPEPTLVASVPSYALTDHVYDPAPGGLRLRVSGGFLTTKDSSDSGKDIEFDEAWMLSVGLGGRVGGMANGVNFSIELDGMFTDQDADDKGALQSVKDVNVAAVFLDGILDFPIMQTLSIYGGAGIGVAWLDIGTASGFSEDDGPFLAWQAKTGLAWRFGANTALHFGYRFVNVDNAEIDDDVNNVSFDLETRQHILEAGLIFGV